MSFVLENRLTYYSVLSVSSNEHSYYSHIFECRTKYEGARTHAFITRASSVMIGLLNQSRWRLIFTRSTAW